jgi:hypothetical protein
MRSAILILALGLSLSACQTLGGPKPDGVSNEWLAALKEIASDPRCAHTDRIQGNLGGLTGNNLSVFLERECPAQPQAPAAP